MSTQVSTITQLNVTEIMTMAKTFADSGMFADTKQAAQAFVKIQAGNEIGIPPFQAMSGIHIIQGKVAIGAGVMASRVKASGKYDYEVKEHNDKICSIDFKQSQKVIGNSTFTIEDAKKALTKNIEKFPKNMLFARAISNGVKFFCPDIFAGPVYVPEEMEQSQETTIDVQHIEQLPELKPGTKKWNETILKMKEGVELGTVKQFFTISTDNEIILVNAVEETA